MFCNTIDDTNVNNGVYHAWALSAQALAIWTMSRLVNRKDVWGGYRPQSEWGTHYRASNGSVATLGKLTTRPSKNQRGTHFLDESLLTRHFRATDRTDLIGVHTTSPENTSKWGAIEIDRHGDSPTAEMTLDAAMGWYDRLVPAGFSPLLLDSDGQGGYHLIVLFSDPAPTPTVFAFLAAFVCDHERYGFLRPPELFPKQPKIDDNNRYGNWLRLPGLHHSRPHYSKVWNGSTWLEGDVAIQFILALRGDDPHLIPEDDPNNSHQRISVYLRRLPHLSAGQGRHRVAYTFSAFLVRDMALDDEQAMHWLDEWDCGNTPPLGREELKKQLGCAHQYGKHPYGSRLHAPTAENKLEPNELPDDPHRLARVYVEAHCMSGSQLTLRYWRDQWYRWQGGAYQVTSDRELRAHLTQSAKAELNRINFLASKAPIEDAKRPHVGKVTQRLVGDVVNALASLTILPSTLEPPVLLCDDAPIAALEALPFRNGILVLRTGDLYPHCPDLFALNALAYDFVPEAPEPTEWFGFLKQLWPDDDGNISTLQEWAGYLLTPDTSQQKILMIIGPKRSGKGVLARVIRRLVGSANVAGPTFAGLATNFGLWPLIGKTVAIVSDARLSGRTDQAIVVERLLSISGEDALTIDRKNLPPITTTLTTRFIICSNELPKLGDASNALSSRMLLLRLTRSWLGQEDPGLTDRLLDGLPGVVNWAIEGRKRLHARGHFKQPAASASMIQDFENLSSPVQAFVRDRCIIDPRHEVRKTDLFLAWRNWCLGRGHDHVGTEASFGRDLNAVVPTLNTRQFRKDGDRIRAYTGICLKPSLPTQFPGSQGASTQ